MGRAPVLALPPLPLRWPSFASSSGYPPFWGPLLAELSNTGTSQFLDLLCPATFPALLLHPLLCPFDQVSIRRYYPHQMISLRVYSLVPIWLLKEGPLVSVDLPTPQPSSLSISSLSCLDCTLWGPWLWSCVTFPGVLSFHGGIWQTVGTGQWLNPPSFSVGRPSWRASQGRWLVSLTRSGPSVLPVTPLRPHARVPPSNAASNPSTLSEPPPMAFLHWLHFPVSGEQRPPEKVILKHQTIVPPTALFLSCPRGSILSTPLIQEPYTMGGNFFLSQMQPHPLNCISSLSLRSSHIGVTEDAPWVCHMPTPILLSHFPSFQRKFLKGTLTLHSLHCLSSCFLLQ